MMLSQVKMPFFRARFESARHWNAQIREATSEFKPLGRGAAYFHWSDGYADAGFAISADGELCYVYSTTRGLGNTLVATAVARGATHLDCFDGYLVTLYKRHGFERVTSVDNWTPGEPDVVYMAQPGHFLTALRKAES